MAVKPYKVVLAIPTKMTSELTVEAESREEAEANALAYLDRWKQDNLQWVGRPAGSEVTVDSATLVNADFSSGGFHTKKLYISKGMFESDMSAIEFSFKKENNQPVELSHFKITAIKWKKASTGRWNSGDAVLTMEFGRHNITDLTRMLALDLVRMRKLDYPGRVPPLEGFVGLDAEGNHSAKVNAFKRTATEIQMLM